MTDRPIGMLEAVRQIRIARHLYQATGSQRLWNDLNDKERRSFIDRSCQGNNRDNDGYSNGEIPQYGSGHRGTNETANFVTLDFETANPNMSSICQVGIAEFSNGRIVDTFTSLVNPNDYFYRFNVGIHGIQSQDVVKSPTFNEIFPELVKRLTGRIVVSHMPFDRSALRQTTALHQLPEIDCRWLDSARVVRRTWSIYAREGYGLRSIAAELGISFKHHNALEDAKTAGMVLLRAIATSGISLEDWMAKSHFAIGRKSVVPRCDGSPSGAFFGECLVFTGSLQIPRRAAADFAAKVGCTVLNSVSRKTSILVVGDQDIARLTSGETKSSKHRKAETLNATGSTIRIIGESDFLTLCNTDVQEPRQIA